MKRIMIACVAVAAFVHRRLPVRKARQKVSPRTRARFRSRGSSIQRMARGELLVAVRTENLVLTGRNRWPTSMLAPSVVRIRQLWFVFARLVTGGNCGAQ